MVFLFLECGCLSHQEQTFLKSLETRILFHRRVWRRRSWWRDNRLNHPAEWTGVFRKVSSVSDVFIKYWKVSETLSYFLVNCWCRLSSFLLSSHLETSAAALFFKCNCSCVGEMKKKIEATGNQFVRIVVFSECFCWGTHHLDVNCWRC